MKLGIVVSVLQYHYPAQYLKFPMSVFNYLIVKLIH